MPVEKLTVLEKLERALQLKERGNVSFRKSVSALSSCGAQGAQPLPFAWIASSKAFEDAAMLYGDVFDVLTQDFTYPPELKAQSRAIKVAVSLNVAACQLQLGQFADAVGICTEVSGRPRSGHVYCAPY